MDISGEARAFRRGVRLAAGFAGLLVVLIVIVVVARDHPLQRGNPLASPNTPASATVKPPPGPSGSELSHS